MAKFSDTEIKVSFERLKTSVDALTLEASTDALTLKSSVDVLTLKAYTQLNELKASFQVGNFPFIPAFIDFTNPINFVSEIFFSFTKNLQDSVDLPSELVSIDVILNKENTGVVTENIAIALEKSFFETSTVSSSGSLISQSYTVDNTYFLEDYVGSSRLFT